jgi:hypothetical protein
VVHVSSSDEHSGQRQINWSTAEIEGGRLTVALSGEAPKGWAKHFDSVLALLDQGWDRWGSIVVHKTKIQVSAVQEGAQGDLRHLLESALLQVNSDLEHARDEGADDRPNEGDEDEKDPGSEADRRMTDAFRGFAERQS